MPTIAQVANAAIPAGVDLATWLNSRNGLNSATSTINAGATQAGQQIDAATATALQAQKDAAAKQQGLYDTTVTNNQPYQDQGKLSLAQLQKLGTNTFDPSSVATDPGYQFGMNEGIKGGQRAAAASGTLGNGGQVRAQTRYALDYATTKYNDAFQRFLQSQQSGLSIAQAGINAGQHANDAVESAGTTLGNQDQTNATTQGTFGVNAAEDKAGLTLAQAELAAKNQTLQSNNTNSTLNTLEPIIADAAKKLIPGLGAAAPTLASVTSGAVPGLSSIAGTTPALAATATPLAALPEAEGAGIAASSAAAPATGIEGALGLNGGSGLLGLGAATIPVVGGIIAGGALLANHFIGQGRKAADKLTGQGGIQHAFEDTLNTIDSAPGQTDSQKWQAKEQAYEKLKTLAWDFAKKGSNEKKVVQQMFDTISPLFGDSDPWKAAA